jgi:hypothetical protein
MSALSKGDVSFCSLFGSLEAVISMGMVVMSKRELNRLDVLARLDSGRLTARAAAELMAITPRQTYRLLRRYRDGGASAVANQRRDRPSNNRLPDVVREHAIALVREHYADFQHQHCHSACNIGSDSLLMQFEGCLAL